MRSLLANRRFILLLAIVSLVALTVLAISLNQLPFRPAQRFASVATGQEQALPEQLARVWTDVPIWKRLTVWLLMCLVLMLVGLLMSPEVRKRMLIIFVRTVVTFWAVYFLLLNYGDRLLLPFAAQNLKAPSQNSDSLAPAPVFQPPQVSPALSYLISFGFALLILATAWGMYRGYKKYMLTASPRSLEAIAKIARASLKDLSSGRDSGDVIIDCYLRMSEVVSDKQKLRRAADMTPREFALRLEQAGLPGEAVSRLTRLFEAVRYGDRSSGPREVDEAVSCLKTILHYCGEPV